MSLSLDRSLFCESCFSVPCENNFFDNIVDAAIDSVRFGCLRLTDVDSGECFVVTIEETKRDSTSAAIRFSVGGKKLIAYFEACHNGDFSEWQLLEPIDYVDLGCEASRLAFYNNPSIPKWVSFFVQSSQSQLRRIVSNAG